MARRKVKYDFNPFTELGFKTPRDPELKASALRLLSEAIEEAVLDDMNSGRSSVTGQRWKSLSERYADEQKGGNRLANLLLDGDLQASFQVAPRGRSELRVTFDDDQQGKADGHNNFSGRSRLPLRRSIPDKSEGETFRRGIRQTLAQRLRELGVERG